MALIVIFCIISYINYTSYILISHILYNITKIIQTVSLVYICAQDYYIHTSLK